MKSFNIAILGCGTVGSGVAKILLDMKDELSSKTGFDINLTKIVDLFPQDAAKKNNIPLNLFCSNEKSLAKEKANEYIQEVINSKDIDLVVETIGGDSEYILKIATDILKAKKHLVTANKALLAKHNKLIFDLAKENRQSLGYEAAVCGAIPIIKTIKESFTGDEVVSISGIMNGTSNFILSKMQEEKLDFESALKMAQDEGFAEADPTLDINGYDAAHKLIILMKLAYGIDIELDQLTVTGIQNITKADLDFANEMECSIKLICFANKKDDKVYATISPMMVKKNNFLSQVNGATNAVKSINKYSGKHILIGNGAGSLETASSIVSDITFIARYSSCYIDNYNKSNYELIDSKYFTLPYNIIFHSDNTPGITGLITTAIGNQKINIDTVGHNRHDKEKAIFSVATMPCSLEQINAAIEEIKIKRPNVLLSTPKIIPILY